MIYLGAITIIINMRITQNHQIPLKNVRDLADGENGFPPD